MVIPKIRSRRRAVEPISFSNLSGKDAIKILICAYLAVYSVVSLFIDDYYALSFYYPSFDDFALRFLGESRDAARDDEIREAAVQAMMKTPGWKYAERYAGTKDERPLDINESYVFAPREEYERLREKYDEDPLSMPSAYHNMYSPSTIESLGLPPPESKHSYIKPYDAERVINTVKNFHQGGFILFFDGRRGMFSIFMKKRYHPVDELLEWKARKISENLYSILRKNNPDRFRRGHPDFSVVLSVGDSPKISCDCIPTPNFREDGVPLPEDAIMEKIADGEEDVCNRYEFAPIWNFASGFVNPEVIPTAITFPPWGYQHLGCFGMYRFRNRVCNEFVDESAKQHGSSLYFGQHTIEVEMDDSMIINQGGNQLESDGLIADSRKLHLQEEETDDDYYTYEGTVDSETGPVQVSVWDYLKPQVMWRGTDFVFLPCLAKGCHKSNLSPEKIRGEDSAEGLLGGLHEMWDVLTPRWKAVTMSLEAELAMDEANDPDSLPWIDAKFTNKQRPGEEDKWHRFLELGGHVEAEEKMDWQEAASYKYHTDFGGGGGTTWLGVKAKLALPGVLLHHETQAYDYFHEDLLPYVHYIPISTELEDLREKYEWAEAHQEEAKAISEAATAFMKYMGTLEYWERLYDRLFVKRMAPTLDAYQQTRGLSGEEAFLNLAKELGYPLQKLV